MMRDERNQEVGTRRTEATLPPQTEKKHPDRWERDLNPDRLEGQNIGLPRDLPSAHDSHELRSSLQDFTPQELNEIAVVPPGARLQQGATYLNLATRSEFTATGDMEAGEHDRLVPKADVPYTLYNRLRGIEGPERTT